ncbi:MAG: hypothetical protein H0W28_12725 [Pyrinomonadaceae bacterium]|nr:hypothetical protein [Pyrinomonadaceae bacterium]
MKILGVGFSRTGTSSLHSALQMLGFTSIHHDTIRLNDVLDGSNARPDFRRYDDVDAVLDLPTAYFYSEIIAAYPNCKCVLTIRDIEDWWLSIRQHFNVSLPMPPTGTRALRARARKYYNRLRRDPPRDMIRFRITLRNCVYGSSRAHEYLFKKKFREHNEQVLAKIPPHRLLVMNISGGDGWDKLCPFLDAARPTAPFPHVNRAGE